MSIYDLKEMARAYWVNGFEVGALGCAKSFRTSEDWRDHLPCAHCASNDSENGLSAVFEAEWVRTYQSWQATITDQMSPTAYHQAALRTEYTPTFVCPDVVGNDAAQAQIVSRLLHAVLGLMSEVGEIANALKVHLIYGRPLDLLNLVEEHGDESWYMNLLIDAIGSTWEASWTKNIAKLRARFPDKFTQERATHRDLDAERRALEGADT